MKRYLLVVLLCLLPLGCALAQDATRGKSVAGKNWHPLFPKLENFAKPKVRRYSVPTETDDGLSVSAAGREGIDVKALVRMTNGIDADNAAFLKRAKAGEAITVWISFDGGETWPNRKMVRKGPGNYTWLAVGRKGTPSEGWIYLLANKDWLARFNLAWLMEKKK